MNKKIWIPKFNYYSKRLSMWQEKFWREVNGKPFMGILDNIAGRRTFEFATFGRSGVQQANSKLFRVTNGKSKLDHIQQMTISHFQCMVVETGPALTTQIDRGSDQYYDDSTGVYDAFGYNVHLEAYFNFGISFGTMDNSTYNDGGGTSRTIKGVLHFEGSPDTTYSNDLTLSIDGASVSNSDTTWLDFTWDDTAGTPRTLTRTTDLTAYTASLNGSTHWRDSNSPFAFTDLDANTDFVLTTS